MDNENENRKGPGVFYAVVGVATLVVAIIGATFAYFSASATGGSGAITGQTADVGAAALSVSTTKYTFSGGSVSNANLVPADIDESLITGNAGANGGSIANALSRNCISDGYTGCHVWKIVVNSTETVDVASVKLNLAVTLNDTTSGHGSKADWKYALFTATDSAAANSSTGALTSPAYLTTIATGTTAYGNLGTDLNSFELNDGVGLTAGTTTGTPSKILYLMVFLDNKDQAQNVYEAGEEAQPAVSVDDTGSYTGTVTLDAGSSGRVVATFAD